MFRNVRQGTLNVASRHVVCQSLAPTQEGKVAESSDVVQWFRITSVNRGGGVFASCLPRVHLLARAMDGRI